MSRIILKEISKKSTRSCNNCSARNYKSTLVNDDKIVDTIYELQVSTMCIALCEDCIKTLYKTVGDFIKIE